jgi:C4-dicarboxylate transporter, DctM subunit
MDASLIELAIVLLLVLVLLLASGLWVGLVLFVIGWLAMVLATDLPLMRVLGTSMWAVSASWTLAALPLFIWMGEILFRSTLSENLFRGLSPWLTWLPGRLMHVNVVGCGLFAAVSGSSAATVVTIGKMSLPELVKRGYDKKMAIGSLAGSGTLGLLIPPSIIMIVYAAAAQVSIIRLFIAGIFPGLLLIALFMGYIALRSILQPSMVPEIREQVTWSERIRALKDLVPVIALIVAVIGSIYTGLATATEAAAAGVLGSLALAAFSGGLTMPTFVEGLLSATRLTSMIMLLLIGAGFLTTAMGFTGIPAALAEWVRELGLNRYMLIAVLCLIYIVLGCFIDGISMIVLTTSIVLPMIQAAGFDLIWFGIVIIFVVEMAQITPPIGFNLYVIQGLTGQDIFSIAWSAAPFFLLLCFAVVLLVIYPEIATWLPSKMMAR